MKRPVRGRKMTRLPYSAGGLDEKKQNPPKSIEGTRAAPKLALSKLTNAIMAQIVGIAEG